MEVGESLLGHYNPAKGGQDILSHGPRVFIMFINLQCPKRFLVFLLPIFLLGGLFYPIFSQAAGSNYFVPENIVIRDDIYQSANRVEINGEVLGDLVVVTDDLKINGHVRGDVIAIGRQITVNGEVDGNLRAISTSLEINGSVAKNVTVAVQDFSLGEQGRVEQNLYLFGGTARIAGTNPGKLWFFGDKMDIAKAKLNQLDLDLSQLSITAGAVIAGGLKYQAKNQASVADGAVISQINWQKVSEEIDSKNDLVKYSTIGYYFGRIINWFSWILLGLVIINLTVRIDLTVSSYLVFNLQKSLIKGLLYLFMVPIFCLLLFGTIIGIPLSIIILVLYLVLLYLSQVFTSIALGFIIFKLYVKVRKVSKELSWIKKGNVLLLLVVGSLVQVVLISLPFIGRYLQFLMIIWGFGGIMAVGGFLFKENKVTVKN